MEYILFVIIGIFAGTLAGLLGLGGGVIVVPGLSMIFAATGIVPKDQIMQLAGGTSLGSFVNKLI